jgi:hypothetical protein
MLLSALVLLALVPAAGVPEETGPKQEVGSAIARGVVLLLESQESLSGGIAGEWPYEGVYRVPGEKGPEIPLGYRVGGTAIAATALLACPDAGPKERVDVAVRRALDFVLASLDDPRMSASFEGGYDVRGWGHAFALDLLLCLRGQKRVPKELEEEVGRRIPALVAALEATEIASAGGWNYSRRAGDEPAPASPFMTAPTLQILFEAAKQGEKVDDAVIGRALDTLEKARRDNGAIQYATRPVKDAAKLEPIEGAIGRMPVTEATLYLAGRGSVDRIRSAVDAFFEHWEWLEKRRKQTGTHVAPFGIAPYYFFYAHRYAAQAIELLPEADREPRRQKLRALLWRVREADGGWNDRVFPRSESFGTAMALFALRSPELAPPAGWKPK